MQSDTTSSIENMQVCKRSVEVKKVSIIIPVYNEAKLIDAAIEDVFSLKSVLEKKNIGLQVIVIDNGSTDGTWESLQRWNDRITLLQQTGKRGKGAAIRQGFKEAQGQIIAIQDADLEYTASAIPNLISPILKGKATVVYGSRYLSGHLDRTWEGVMHGILNKIFNFSTGWRTTLTDMETAQKVFLTEYVQDLDLRRNSFTFEIELTHQLFRLGANFMELPIEYTRRSVRDGKKARWIRDGLKAILEILRQTPKSFFYKPDFYISQHAQGFEDPQSYSC